MVQITINIDDGGNTKVVYDSIEHSNKTVLIVNDNDCELTNELGKASITLIGVLIKEIGNTIVDKAVNNSEVT